MCARCARHYPLSVDAQPAPLPLQLRRWVTMTACVQGDTRMRQTSRPHATTGASVTEGGTLPRPQGARALSPATQNSAVGSGMRITPITSDGRCSNTTNDCSTNTAQIWPTTSAMPCKGRILWSSRTFCLTPAFYRGQYRVGPAGMASLSRRPTKAQTAKEENTVVVMVIGITAMWDSSHSGWG